MIPFRVGPWEIGLVVLLVVLIFGVGKLPQVGEAIGKGLRAFRRGQQGENLEEESPKPKGKAAKKIAKTAKNSAAK